MVFQHYALYPHMTVRRTWRSACVTSACRRPRSRARSPRPPQMLEIAPLLDRRPGQLVGRPAPARRHRPRHRQAAAGLPVRRAAVQPRRRPAQPHPHRTGPPAPAHEGHHDLRHPRPGRGDDDGHAHRGDEPGPDRAGRHADGDLPAARSTRFVAGFVGTPAMNFLPVVARRGARRPCCRLPGRRHRSRPGITRAAPSRRLTLGVRAEHSCRAAAPSAARRSSSSAWATAR